MNGHETNGTAPVLSEAERLELEDDLKKTEDEVETLRQVLQARLRHANELKRKLGLTPWKEIASDINAGWRTVRDSSAVKQSEEALKHTGDVMKTKLGEVRNSETFKSFENRFGSAMSTVKRSVSKAKLATSTSMYAGLHGHTSDGAAYGEQAGANTQPTTPSSEKKM